MESCKVRLELSLVKIAISTDHLNHRAHFRLY